MVKSKKEALRVKSAKAVPGGSKDEPAEPLWRGYLLGVMLLAGWVWVLTLFFGLVLSTQNLYWLSQERPAYMNLPWLILMQWIGTLSGAVFITAGFLYLNTNQSS